jgi:hypothetical protein
MNGRLYDPVLGRFFSPDKYVANGSFTQDFNRYTYARNNPLMYTDPDGEWVHLLVGAVVGGLMNWMTHGAEFTWKGLGYFGIGAAAGLLSAGIGAGVSTAMAPGGSFAAGFIGTSAVSTTGFVAGAATGLAAGATNGLILGTGNALLEKQKFGKALGAGFDQMWKQGFMGAGIGGIMGGLDALSKGRDFWTGSYKTYKLPVNYIASTNNEPFYDRISIPEKATVANEDSYNVYYKPEKGEYGIGECVVEPGYYIKDPIDGVATSKYSDAVFKVPSGGRVRVLPGGDVVFLNPNTVSASAELANIRSILTTGQVYEYGWLPLSKLDNGWATLFINALRIK